MYSIAKPTKSSGGRPCFQFIARRHMPSPRCALSVKSAAPFFPSTWHASFVIVFAPRPSLAVVNCGVCYGRFTLVKYGQRWGWATNCSDLDLPQHRKPPEARIDGAALCDEAGGVGEAAHRDALLRGALLRAQAKLPLRRDAPAREG